MIREIIMPKLGETMEEGYLVSWKKQEGEKVEKGEVLFEVMSDKTNFEVESPYSGYLRKILFSSSDEAIPVTTVIGYISDNPDEQLPEKEEKIEKKEVKEEKVEIVQKEKVEEKIVEGGEKIKATPVAKRIAQERGIDISNIRGTGPGGRIEKRDVEKYIESKAVGVGEYEIIKWTPIRKIIAKRLTESKREIPHYYFQGKFIMDQIALIKELKKKEGNDFSYTDFLLFFAGKAIEKYPLIDASVENDEIRVYKSIDIGLAVAVEEGLVVPVIRNICQKTIEEISEERKTITKKAKEGTLAEDDLKGARFVISNLGMYGVENFQPIINPPGVAIMGVGKIEKGIIVIEDKIEVKRIMSVSFSFDHRVIDGSYAGSF
ncbi:MAG TPA: dihydrolipoamide acetyltransferase family protein, partial [Candidatus Ratteibacteria bacterium]|nr:dihydrolipoamide acetyltransferase family protein [Candidatus Ratteibacteria bacterium]